MTHRILDIDKDLYHSVIPTEEKTLEDLVAILNINNPTFMTEEEYQQTDHHKGIVEGISNSDIHREIVLLERSQSRALREISLGMDSISYLQDIENQITALRANLK